MTKLKYILIGILFVIPSIIKGQELNIDFSYNKISNSLILNLYNPTDQNIRVMNQATANEFAGSFIILTQNTSKGLWTFSISLFDIENGERVHAKIIPPKGKLELCYPFDYIPASNVIKAQLELSTYLIDSRTNKLTPKRYSREVTLKSATPKPPSGPIWYN